MTSYRVRFMETKTRHGYVIVEADSPEAAKERVGNDYRYSPESVRRKAKSNKSLSPFTDVLYPKEAIPEWSASTAL